jgi:outer membrane protein TolC
VRQAYWALRQALEQIEIQRRALELAQRQFEDNKIRVEIGTMAQIETLQSETQVVNSEQALLNAEIGWRTAELNLKRLLVTGTGDALYSATLNPIDLPAYQPPAIDVDAAIDAALAQRTDITQTRRSLEVTRLNLELTENAILPALDLNSSYRLSGTQTTYSNTLGDIGRVENPTWSFSFNFTYPLGMRQAKANFARAQLQLDQSLVQLQSQELTVSTEVTNAGLAVDNTYKQLQAAIKATEVAERNAEAEQVRFDVGMSNNYNVAQALNNLTNARLTQLSRTIAYINAIAEFDRVQRVGR